MLQLYKNEVITSIAQRHVELRQMELDWYTNNLWTLSQQSALLAGFAFGQLTTQLPKQVDFRIECPYLLLTASSLGLHLCVLVCTTFCCVWGPGLALRGPHGSHSVHLAIDNLQSEQTWVFAFFVLGLISFLGSHMLLTWAYYSQWVACLATVIIGAFGLAISLFILIAVAQLRVTDSAAVTGRIRALHQYEEIADLDEVVMRKPNFPLHYSQLNPNLSSDEDDLNQLGLIV